MPYYSLNLTGNGDISRMCGIAGIWGKADKEIVKDMMGKLAHRGPDAEGMHVNPSLGVLGHRRLSIMDPHGGDQPIYSEDGSSCIVANGEIYNFPRLRVDLQDDHEFRTGNDSEAILHLVEDLGPSAVRALDGMFAFAVDRGESLFLARDPIGIKPLYYGIRENGTPNRVICFASELKALVDKVDDAHEFPAGTCYLSESGFKPYYRVPDLTPRDIPAEMVQRTLRETLEEAVVKRLMSDVPLGAFLSGGIDSSIIAAIVRKHLDSLHTFSVGTEGSRDLEAARIVAEHIGSIHHEYVYTPEEVLEKLPDIVYHLESFDQDLVRSAIPCYFCSRLAADHVKVILTGEGADELFAGYTYYREISDPEALRKELRRSVTSLHNLNLQRVDRLTMAHGLEGRVPFLDLAMVELAQVIPPQLKLRGEKDEHLVEKWILRQACEDLLPPEILCRRKEQFDEGSGTVELLGDVIVRATEGMDSAAYADRFPEDSLRSPEECYYHKLLRDVFPNPKIVLQNVASWAQAT